MPRGAVDGAVLLGQVVGVADPVAGVGHEPVSGGVGEGQPAEHVIVGGGRGLAEHRHRARAVERERHHQLSALQVPTQNERDLLHPRHQSARLHRHLGSEVRAV